MNVKRSGFNVLVLKWRMTEGLCCVRGIVGKSGGAQGDRAVCYCEIQKQTDLEPVFLMHPRVSVWIEYQFFLFSS